MTLHLSAEKGFSKIVKYLDYGAKVDEPDKNGFTALRCAAKYGHMDIAAAPID